MASGATANGLNKYEGLFGKLGLLLLVVFLLLVLAGYTSGSTIGKVMTTVLLFVVLLIMGFGHVVSKELAE